MQSVTRRLVPAGVAAMPSGDCPVLLMYSSVPTDQFLPSTETPNRLQYNSSGVLATIHAAEHQSFFTTGQRTNAVRSHSTTDSGPGNSSGTVSLSCCCVDLAQSKWSAKAGSGM